MGRCRSDYGLKESLVVFGVGDHGGGPTREMIETGQGSSRPTRCSPRSISSRPTPTSNTCAPSRRRKTLPVVDTDLQYTFTGCYTTHADMKKAVRQSENNLYAAEVFVVAGRHARPAVPGAGL